MILLFCADLILFPGGDSGFTALVPNASEQSGEDDEQDEGKGEEREEDRTSVEVQIGRKLREIGDHFQQEHMQLVRTDNPTSLGYSAYT